MFSFQQSADMGVVGRGQLMYDRNTASPTGNQPVREKTKASICGMVGKALCHAICQRFQTMERK
jgi:hypothetical protein